ncbi:MAG: serine/threonine-protein kinase [Gemmataceae bacterium]
MNSFHPAQYQGKPLPDLLSRLAGAEAGEVWAAWQGRVELYSAVDEALEATLSRPGTLLSTLSETYLPEDHPEVDVPGVLLETYLGGGGQGWVYAGRVRDTNRVVAVKVLRGEYVQAQGKAAREALLCARVRHRNVLRVFQTQPAGAFWVMIMELVQGPELNAEFVQADQARRTFGQLADALRAVADAGIVHRDIKPANILIRQQDRSPVLVDFGLAVDLRDVEHETVEVSGTPFFMPPEAFESKPPEPSWDAYSLGVTAAALLARPGNGYTNLLKLRTAKLSGEFDQQVRQALGQIETVELRTWIDDLLSDDRQRRLAAVEIARAWRGK